MVIAAIIFDFDGVLVDSEPMHEAALRAAVREAGMDFTHEQYLARYVGLDDRDVYRRVAEDHRRSLPEESARHLHALKWRYAQEAIQSGAVRPFPGAVELLHTAARDRLAAICSGARRHEIEAILAHIGVPADGLIVVSADDVSVSKPDPAPYVLTAQRLGLAPAACLAIEDTPRGIRSARGAGCRVVGVCHTLSAAELGEADRVVPALAELTLSDLLGKS